MSAARERLIRVAGAIAALIAAGIALAGPAFVSPSPDPEVLGYFRAGIGVLLLVRVVRLWPGRTLLWSGRVDISRSSACWSLGGAAIGLALGIAAPVAALLCWGFELFVFRRSYTATKLPARVISTEDDPIYGDTVNELAFSDWKERDGLRLPDTQTTSLNGHKFRFEQVRSVIHNPAFAASVFEIPAEVRALPEDGERILSQWVQRRIVMGVPYQDFARKQKVELFEIAPGVFHVRGSSHHSLAVEMKDHLIVVEAPLFEERSLAVIAALERKFPGKPIKYLVITHFHFDHTGGVRAYAAKGATLIVHPENLGFIQELLSRPHTIRPDSWSKADKTPVIETVAELRAFSDGARTLEVRDRE